MDKVTSPKAEGKCEAGCENGWFYPAMTSTGGNSFSMEQPTRCDRCSGTGRAPAAKGGEAVEGRDYVLLTSNREVKGIVAEVERYAADVRVKGGYEFVVLATHYDALKAQHNAERRLWLDTDSNARVMVEQEQELMANEATIEQLRQALAQRDAEVERLRRVLTRASGLIDRIYEGGPECDCTMDGGVHSCGWPELRATREQCLTTLSERK